MFSVDCCLFAIFTSSSFRGLYSLSLSYHAHEPWWWRRTPASFLLDACLMMLAQEWRSFALGTCSRQQRTLACCPPPAQVFSQQLPNQMQFFFFQILKYKMISKVNISWWYILFYQKYFIFFKIGKQQEFFENIYVHSGMLKINQ